MAFLRSLCRLLPQDSDCREVLLASEAMGKSFLAVLLFLSGSVCVCWCSKAQGGKFTGPHAIQQSLYLPKDATQEEVRGRER